MPTSFVGIVDLVVAADIIRTVALEVELEGRWPWQRMREERPG